MDVASCSILNEWGYYSFCGSWFMKEEHNGVCAPSLNDISDSERVVAMTTILIDNQTAD